MGRRKRPVHERIFGNPWSVMGFGTLVCCAWIVHSALRPEPGPNLSYLPDRAAVAGAVAFGAACAVYALRTSRRLAKTRERLSRAKGEVEILRERNRHLEQNQSRQARRLDELVTLREMATVVNQESDFAIIAEKTLELVSGLLEPIEVTMFLEDPKKDKMLPYAQFVDGSFRMGKKVLTRSIPDFKLAQFQSHSIVCRVHGMELHAIVPLKVEDKTHGVLFLVFTTDGRPADVQRHEFDTRCRHALMEMAHHISLAVKTKYFHTKAVVDKLTELYTRSHFDTQISSAIELARRSNEPFCLVLVDIDHFKKVNDTYGHATGDVVLERVASRIKKILRRYDSAYRYGGEELAVILPNTHLREATGIADRLRTEVEAHRVRGARNKLVPVTISLGVAEFQRDDDPESIFQRADECLYAAKDGGRNQVVPAPPAVAA